MKKKISIIFGFILGVFFMYMAFRGIDYKNIITIYSKVNPLYLLPCVFIVILELFIRGLKWRLLLVPGGKISVLNSFRLEAIGLALNNILPLRMGEIARAFWASKVTKISLITVFSTIFMERVLDSVFLFILFMISIRMDVSLPVVSDFGKYFWLLMVVVAMGIAFLAFIDKIISIKKLKAFFEKHVKIQRFLNEASLGAKAFHKPALAIGIFFLGLIQWSLDALNVYLIATAFDLQSVLNFFKSVKLLFVGAAAASIPAMPGFFGNYEYALTEVMKLWQIPKETGFAFASYFHLAFYFTVTFLGLFFIYKMGWSVSKIWKKFKDAK